MSFRAHNDQCRQCTNCCRVRFDVDDQGNVAKARRRVFTHRGTEFEECPNLAKAEGRELEQAQAIIHCRVTPKVVLSGH